MPAKRLSMRKIKEILRLHFELNLSERIISTSLGCSRSAVGDYIKKSITAKITWKDIKDLPDEQVESFLFSKNISRKKAAELPMEEIHLELKKKYVTKELLWHEYKNKINWQGSYSLFCMRYRDWSRGRNIYMRQQHNYGEKLFIDYAGPTVKIYDLNTNSSKDAQIFVCALGGSNYTYAEASWSQNSENFISSHIRAFEYFGGVAKILVPDNLKSAVDIPSKYESEINKSYLKLAEHYNCVVIPARVRKPKDKAKVESAVLLVERWILACIRDKKYYSLSTLNEDISILLEKLNSKKFKKLPGSRKSIFTEYEKPALIPLPKTEFEHSNFKLTRVGLHYHIEYDKNYYSVPYTYARKEVEIRVTLNTIEVLYRNARIASHIRQYSVNKWSTQLEHMPRSHKEVVEWTPEKIVNCAKSIGEYTSNIIEKILHSKEHPQQGFNSAFGIIRLKEKYGEERLEACCYRAYKYNIISYRQINNLLKNGCDKIPFVEEEISKIIQHENIRGTEYFHDKVN